MFNALSNFQRSFCVYHSLIENPIYHLGEGLAPRILMLLGLFSFPDLINMKCGRNEFKEHPIHPIFKDCSTPDTNLSFSIWRHGYKKSRIILLSHNFARTGYKKCVSKNINAKNCSKLLRKLKVLTSIRGFFYRS